MLVRLGRNLFSRPCAAFYSSQSAMQETEAIVRETAINAVLQQSESEPDARKTLTVRNGILLPRDLSYESRHELPDTSRRRPPPPEILSRGPTRYNDVFLQHNLDPVSLTLNPAIFLGYLSEMGKIYGRPITRLTMKSQRRMGKAVRRARMMGVIPIHSIPKKSFSWGQL